MCVVSVHTERDNDIKISLYEQEKYYLFLRALGKAAAYSFAIASSVT